ncbi:porin [Pandoraea nosoerga]|uniref:Porin n=1 Tax=Pandoraea nosoerga TaxID=2508296 RepID=A0A5E4S1G2_9BURK|nr:porin [Pandoraea nosoerga]MBN4667686.1 porin [Pandoraea nosoerga]MBN4676638.1 porin [Pandoraea nosoerga]MBN4683086.1 porin [Pandoraea nosoerga]MBN4743431.1 porin [Pandoraea nosoerga]VVD68983.1 porin [Pandoraea nosoerga]
MKKTQLAAALGGVLAVCAAGAAQAQSNVTLYGVLDGGLSYVSNVGGSKNFGTADGLQSGNRWGLKGSEDLGGGLSAIFTLENGFNLTNGGLGQGSREFGRQAFVGLSSKSFGSLTIGRQYDSVVDFVSGLTSAKLFATKLGAHVGDVDNLYNSFRINNSIKYTSANYAGFTFGGLYGFSNQASSGTGGTGFANNRAYSVGASYANGPVKFGIGYLEVSSPNSTNTGGAVAGDYSGDFYTARIGTATVGVDKQRVLATGGSYSFGPAAVGFVYSNTQLKYVSGTGARVSNYELNGTYNLTPSLLLGLSYTYTDASTRSATLADLSPKYHQVNAAVDYSLSKRTDVYLVGIYQKAAGDATAASINGAGGASSTKTQAAVISGLRHKF